jgi:hypothetical protein
MPVPQRNAISRDCHKMSSRSPPCRALVDTLLFHVQSGNVLRAARLINPSRVHRGSTAEPIRGEARSAPPTAIRAPDEHATSQLGLGRRCRHPTMIKRSSLPPKTSSALVAAEFRRGTGGSSPRQRGTRARRRRRQAPPRPVEPVTRRHSAHDRRRPDDDHVIGWRTGPEPRERVGVGASCVREPSGGHRPPVAATLRWRRRFPARCCAGRARPSDPADPPPLRQHCARPDPPQRRARPSSQAGVSATEPRRSLIEEGERFGAAVGRLRCLSRLRVDPTAARRED